MQNKLEDDDWREKHSGELQTAIKGLKYEIIKQQRLYTQLTGGLVAPGVDVTKTDEEKGFDEDFFENTYFGGR